MKDSTFMEKRQFHNKVKIKTTKNQETMGNKLNKNECAKKRSNVIILKDVVPTLST